MNEVDIIEKLGAEVFLSDPQSVDSVFLVTIWEISLCRLIFATVDDLYETNGIPFAVEFQVLDKYRVNRSQSNPLLERS